MALEKVTYVDRETTITARNLNDIQDAIIELEENDTAKGEQISDLEQATTATTIGPVPIATFDASAADMPLKQLTVNIEPVQSGSGDPSPENVRPIEGWTGCNIIRSPTLDAQNGTTYPITFPSEAGTVYGGTLDFPNKKLTVDRAFRTYAASEVTAQGTSTGRFNVPCPADSVDRGKWSFSAAKLPIANKAKADLSGSVNDYCIYKRYATTTYTIKLPVTELAEARTILDGLEICYYLASPLDYDLTDIPDVLTLIGTNNIWADCGDLSVTYGAYLEMLKAHAERLGDSILSAIAPLEASYTASRAYTVGSYLFVGTKFYKVTAAIGSGDTINPGTNVTQTTVAAQLMELAGN